MSNVPTTFKKNDNEVFEDFAVAHWYKKPYPSKLAADLLKHHAYYQLGSSEKAVLLAFRVVGEPSSDCTPCTTSESMDLESQRMRRQGLHLTD